MRCPGRGRRAGWSSRRRPARPPSRGCRKSILRGRGSTRVVRVNRLNGRRLKNGTKITVTASLNGRLTTTVVDRVRRARRVEGRPVCKPVGC